MAEIAAQNSRSPAPILRIDRIVQAKLDLDRVNDVGGRELSRNNIRDVAGKNLSDAKDQHRHHDENGKDSKQALNDVADHPCPPVGNCAIRLAFESLPSRSKSRAEEFKDQRARQKAGLPVMIDHRIYLDKIEANHVAHLAYTLKERAHFVIEKTVDCRRTRTRRD